MSRSGFLVWKWQKGHFQPKNDSWKWHFCHFQFQGLFPTGYIKNDVGPGAAEEKKVFFDNTSRGSMRLISTSWPRERD
jgi:hypothetical protein